MLSTNRIKLYRSLQQKKYRQKYGQFLVEGQKSVQEFINQGWTADAIIVQENKSVKFNSEVEGVVISASERQMSQMSNFKTPSEAIAVFKTRNAKKLNLAKSIIALDTLSDPGNLGTIIRIADWYGIEQVLISELTVDEYNPKTIAATMGSFARIKVLRGNLVHTLTPFLGNVYAAILKGESIYEKPKPSAAFCLLIGSESHGINPDLLKQLDPIPVSIQGKGGAESLNAGVATGILVDRLIHG